MSADAELRELVAGMAVPDYDDDPWTVAPRVERARVGIVTTAGLYRRGEDPFELFDQSYRMLPAEERDLIVGHNSLNFDRTGVLTDLNVVYPVDRLAELAADGAIGSVAPRHVAFMGAQMDTMSTITLDTGPAAAAALREDDVDVAVITTVCPFCPRTPWAEAGLQPNPMRAAGLIAAYYQQAAVGLADHVPFARHAESWYAQHTAAAATIRCAQAVMREQGAPEPIWFYLLPVTQQGTVPRSMRDQ